MSDEKRHPGSRTASATLLALWLLAAALPVAAAPADELDALVRDLVDAARSADPVAVDEPVCLDWLGSAHLLRSEALGLVEDAASRATQAAWQADYRARLRDFVERHSGGGDVAAVDASSATLHDGAEARESLPALSAAGVRINLPVTGAGAVTVRWTAGARETQIPAVRLGDYWCLNPAL